MRPRSDPEVASWLAKAGEDLGAAELLFSSEGPYHAVVCYLCQQAAEKALKALLVALDRSPPRTHDLGILLQSGGAVPMGPEVRPAAVFLNDFSVLPRYPSPTPPERTDAAKALSAARTVRGAVEAALAP